MKFPDIRDAEILITGGAGFIGSNLAQMLVKKKARVTIVDVMIRPYGGNLYNLKDIADKITVVNEDVRKKTIVKKLIDGKDMVFHLAAQTGRVISMKKPWLDLEINCFSTLSILEEIRKKNKKAKLIFTSSRGVIGNPLYFPVDENHPTIPRDLYGAHKLLAEKYCFIYGREYGIGVTVLRFNNIYGPKCQVRSNHYGTINLFIRYALEKKALPIYGSGKQTRDYLYVSDAVNALMAVIDKKVNNEYFFVGSGKETTLLEIAQKIKKHIRSTTYHLVPYPKELESLDFERFSSSSKKIKKMLAWEPIVTLEDGIQKTVAYYKKYLPYYL